MRSVFSMHETFIFCLFPIHLVVVVVFVVVAAASVVVVAAAAAAVVVVAAAAVVVVVVVAAAAAATSVAWILEGYCCFPNNRTYSLTVVLHWAKSGTSQAYGQQFWETV